MLLITIDNFFFVISLFAMYIWFFFSPGWEKMFVWVLPNEPTVVQFFIKVCHNICLAITSFYFLIRSFSSDVEAFYSFFRVRFICCQACQDM